MDFSTLPDPMRPLTPREAVLDTVVAQSAAIDELIGIAQQRLQIFDVDLSQCGWNTPARTRHLAEFLRRAKRGSIEIIVHDVRWLETACPRLLALQKAFSQAVTVYRTGAEARSAMDPLLIADGRHFLHRFHFDHPRATLAVEHPQLASALVTRFEQIWATGEPGLGATVLGL